MNIHKGGHIQIHEWGTKFYEAIQLWNQSAGRGVLIKRWGKLDKCHSHSCQVKLEMFTDERNLGLARLNILNEKEGRGYNETFSSYGLFNEGHEVPSVTLESVCFEHYGRLVANRICIALGVELIVDSDSVDDGIVCEEPAPELERGGDWASW